jgi:twitching motility protein PilT
MAQLDRLLSVMVSQRASALRLDESQLAELDIAGVSRPVTKTPLTGPQVLALVREVAPADAAASLDAGQGTNFSYLSDDGAFVVHVKRDGERWRASVVLDDQKERVRQRVTGQYKANDIQEYQSPTPSASSGAVAAPPAPPTAAALAAAASLAGPPAHASEAGSIIGEFAGSVEAKATLDGLLRLMVEKGSSDLHLRCGEPPIIRLHGEMMRLEQPPLEPHGVEAMIRSVMPERNRHEYVETNDTDYAYELPGVARFRANALKDRTGPAAVFRQIPATVVTVEQMNITPEVQRLCQLNKGLVLVTGPTGSGKSTTLCALIDLVNRSRSDHVLTIEDPIEFVHPSKKCVITQRQVGVHTGSFKSALRAALREDPDVILVGELRDLETVAIAIETAETGHLVFGTLHTTTAAGTVDRIIDQFPADRQAQIRVMLAESLKGVISQTLCKKIGGGRVAAREILLTIPAVSNLIREGKTFQIPTVMQTSKRLGMVTLNDALLELVDGKLIEPPEGYSKAVDKTGFVQSLKSRGIDTAFAEDVKEVKPAPGPAGKR